VRNLVRRCGWRVLAQCPSSTLLLFLGTVKENFIGERFESADDINTAVTASLLRLSKDEYSYAADRLPHVCMYVCIFIYLHLVYY